MVSRLDSGRSVHCPAALSLRGPLECVDKRNATSRPAGTSRGARGGPAAEAARHLDASEFWDGDVRTEDRGRSRRTRYPGTRSVVTAPLRRCAPLRTGRHMLVSRWLPDVILHSAQTDRKSAKLQS